VLYNFWNIACLPAGIEEWSNGNVITPIFGRKITFGENPIIPGLSFIIIE